jgi:hypothetical protein
VPRQPSWIDQELIDAVDVSTSFTQVCDRLGLRPGAVARLKLETLHLDRRERTERRSRQRWTDECLAAAVRESTSIADVFRGHGYNTAGGIHRFVTRHIRRLAPDTSHSPVSRGRRACASRGDVSGRC